MPAPAAEVTRLAGREAGALPSATLTLVWPLEGADLSGAKHQLTRAQTDAGSQTQALPLLHQLPGLGRPRSLHTFSAPMLGHFQL